MIEIPSVKTFCGCCRLKIPCIVYASLRILAGIYLFCIFVALFINAIHEKRNSPGVLIFLIFWLFVLLAIAVVNIVLPCLFIRGIRSNQPYKMKHFTALLAVETIICLLFALFAIFNVPRPPFKAVNGIVAVAALIVIAEAYTFICLYSLYVELSSKENHTNTVIVHTTVEHIDFWDATGNSKDEHDQQPPPYSSCVDNANGEQVKGRVDPKLYP